MKTSELDTLDDQATRLLLNNERLVVENYFGAVSAQIREKILERNLSESTWKDLLFRIAVTEQQPKSSPIQVSSLAQRDTGVDLDIVDKIVRDTGLNKNYVHKILACGLSPTDVYDCHYMANKHDKKTNLVVSFNRKGMNTDILALLLQAEEDTGLRITTLQKLMTFCHGSDNLKEVLEEEVVDVFSEAVERVADLPDELVRKGLETAQSLEVFELEDLILLIQKNLEESEKEWWDRYSTRPAKPYTERRTQKWEK